MAYLVGVCEDKEVHASSGRLSVSRVRTVVDDLHGGSSTGLYLATHVDVYRMY